MHSATKYFIYNIDSINTFLTKFWKKSAKKALSGKSAFMDCFATLAMTIKILIKRKLIELCDYFF